MIETLIVPGLGGSGPGHWQRHWAASDPGAETVNQEEPDRPRLCDWLHALEARLEGAPGAVLVAHSLGCTLVAALAGRPAAAHVAGALLVAPAEIGPLAERVAAVAEFGAAAAAARRLPFPTILVASRNDPYMPFEAAEAQARAWGSGLVDLGHAGHINVASGFGPWPDGMVLAEGLRRDAARRPRSLVSPRPAPGEESEARAWWGACGLAAGLAHDAAGLGA